MIALSQSAIEHRMLGLLGYLDAGAQHARLRIYGGARPVNINDPPATPLLAEVRLAKPAGMVTGGQMVLTPDDDGLILATGIATWARLINGAGTTAADMDCGDLNSSAEIRLSQTILYAGGMVRLASAVLT